MDLGGHELRRGLGLHHRGRAAEHRGRAAGRDPRPPEGPPPQQGALADAGRRGVPAAVPAGGPRRAGRAVRARDRGLDPEREHQRRGLLDVVRQRRGHGRAADAQLVARPARAPRLGRGRDRHVRDLRRHPRDGRQPDRVDGPRRLPRLGLPLRRRPADRERPRLPGAAGELHGDAGLAAVPGGRPRARDPARRPAAPAVAVRQDRARGLRPRGLLRAGRLRQGLQLAQVPGEDRLLGAGRQLQRAQARLDGAGSAAARTSAGSASAARCRGSPTSSCRSWTRRPAAACRR